MKNLFFTLALMLLNCVYSQNPITIIAPNYFNSSTGFTELNSLPEPGGIYSYHGEKAECSSNAISDKYGNLFCFVVDGNVYDKDGYLLEILYHSSSNNTLAGRSETMIIPDPTNCNRLYIISTGRNYSNDAANDEIQFVLIDFTLLSSYSPTKLGGLYSSGVLYTGLTKEGNCHLAVTKKRSDNSQFLFITTDGSLRKYKIDANGINYVNNVASFPNALVNTFIRAELEIYQSSNPTVDGYYYQVAAPYRYKQDPVNQNSPIGDAIYKAKLDINGNLINGSEKIYYYEFSGNQNVPSIKGLEFDKYGRYLFISHNINSTYYTAIDYVDNQNPNNLYHLNNTNDFENSQIEFSKLFGIEGLLVINNQKMGRISTTSTGVISFQSNIANQGINPSYMYTDINGWSNYQYYKVYLLPDQIDNTNYSEYSIENFNVISHTATTNATWTAGNLLNNPFNVTNGVVTVQNELRIPAGKTITISGMTFQFAPGARVVIENSTNSLQGGKLFLTNGTVFTSVESYCGVTDMWRGVEVWGNKNLTQGTLTNTKQGYLNISSNSIIENAYIGAEAAKRNSATNFSYDASGYGGIIRTNDATFKNNRTDIRITDYLPGANSSNLSRIETTEFKTDGLLKNSNYYTAEHLYLRNVNRIYIYASIFKNYTPQNYTLDKQGVGIRSISTWFRVYGYRACNDCPPLQSTFENLNTGISATTALYDVAFSVDESYFGDNIYGISASNVDNFQIFGNTFDLRKFTKTGAYTQSNGIYMSACTGYGVDRNYISTPTTIVSNPASTHGIVVINSGTANNEIYKNTFTNLDFGGQSESINAQITSGLGNISATGLQWKCNTFTNVMTHDLFVKNGHIRPYQGEISYPANPTDDQRRNYAANNVFSTVNASPDNHVRMENSNNVMIYIHLNPTSHIPTSFTASNLPSVKGLTKIAVNLSPNSNTCPNRIHLIPIEISQINGLRTIVSELNDAKNQLKMYTENEIAYKEAAFNYGSLLSKVNQLENSMTRSILNDSIVSETTFLSFLDEMYDKSKAAKLRFEYFYNSGDLLNARAVLTENVLTNEFIDLAKIRLDMRFSNSTTDFLQSNSKKSSNLTGLSQQTNDSKSAIRAKNILQENQDVLVHYTFLMPEYKKNGNVILYDDLAENESTGFKLFPNPANSSIRLQTISAEKVNARILIFDVTGKVVDTKSMNRAELFIDIQALENGIYLVQITNNETNEVETIRFVKY